MITFAELAQNIKSLRSQYDFSQYLESSLIEIETLFNTLSYDTLNALKFDIEDLLYDLEDRQLVVNENPSIINAFLILLAQKFEQAGLIGAIVNVLNYLPKSSVKKRLEAAKLYLRVNNIATDYFTRFDAIATLINESTSEEEADYKAVSSLLYYYLGALGQFHRINNSSLAKTLNKLFEERQTTYPLLSHPLIRETVSTISIENFTTSIVDVKAKIDALAPNTQQCALQNLTPHIEQSSYSKALYNVASPSFETVRELAYSYVKATGDPQSLYERLSRGEAIIDSEELLFKYMVSFGAKHKAKLYSAFDVVANSLKDENVNIIDWGCGQAMASMVLFEYIREKKINLSIKNICLIEPSLLALNRGLLHVDIFKNSACNVVAINSDLDCLKDEDLFFDKRYKTIHLFSNILDIEGFTLNHDFFQKVSSTLNNNDLFICVSPNINDKRNTRLDLFYKHFDENFDTKLISSRANDVEGHKRYEKIFEVTAFSENVTVSSVAVTPVVPHYDFIAALNQLEVYVSPTLDTKKVSAYITSDPEYVIFKVRKIAEILTSNIYKRFESNGVSISFSDKIRYLSYEKNVFTKSMTNYLQTIRTIGNGGVHEERKDMTKESFDAQLMVLALINLIKNFEEGHLL